MGFLSTIGSGLAAIGTGGLSAIGNALGGTVGNLLSPTSSGYTQEDINAQNLAASKEYAQNSIQWKVDDANKAGISPLAAMGAVGYTPPVSQTPPTDNTYRDSFSQMGQNVTRASLVAQSDSDRALQEVQMRKMNADADFAENQAKLSAIQVARAALPPSNPSIPDGSVAHPIPDTVHFVDQFGHVYTGPSADSSQSNHGTLFGPTVDFLKRNIIGPAGELMGIASNEAAYNVGTSELKYAHSGGY